MISEEQKLDILRDVEANVGNWVGEALAVGVVSREFQALNEIFQKAQVDLNDLFHLGPVGVLNVTKKAAEKLGLSEIDVAHAVDNWSVHASQLLGLKQAGYPE
ncbi:hypothetical protein [Acinetobacter pecorum]|uniref:Uncharacterized protein n=1 Tax=Acinetobacter pecorum TaxID=2762215 RepID=A0ABR8VU63_9GAMM|nr:hypothetical protein [Acinetobacter pecorum]MBD8008308.1 hypothetical protein [Acinetobacter pecorum]